MGNIFAVSPIAVHPRQTVTKIKIDVVDGMDGNG
jgi:hypothetical protein